MYHQCGGSDIQISGGNINSYINNNSSRNQNINYGANNTFHGDAIGPPPTQYPPPQYEAPHHPPPTEPEPEPVTSYKDWMVRINELLTIRDGTSKTHERVCNEFVEVCFFFVLYICKRYIHILINSK